MGAKVPAALSESPLAKRLAAAGLPRLHQGKVRDTFALPGDDLHLLLVATDRLSIFDFVLGAEVPDKGAVLTALTVFWMTRILKGRPHHLVAFGRGLNAHLPPALHDEPLLLTRGMIVKKLSMLPVECVVRGYLTGSGLLSYQTSGQVCGHVLPAGLHDGSRLPSPLFTPTTKAETGHDEAWDAAQVGAQFGTGLEEESLAVFREIGDYAQTRGILLADTKFEFGRGLVLGDEVATPDSSRFWDKEEWEKAVALGRSPQGYDKQPVREWGKGIQTPFLDSAGLPLTGLQKLDCEDDAQVAFVAQTAVPEAVLAATTARYRAIFERLTGQSLERFQKDVMGL